MTVCYFSLPGTSKLKVYWLKALTIFGVIVFYFLDDFLSQWMTLPCWCNESEWNGSLVMFSDSTNQIYKVFVNILFFAGVGVKENTDRTWAQILTALATLNFSLSSLTLACGNKSTWLRPLMGVNPSCRDGDGRKDRGPQVDRLWLHRKDNLSLWKPSVCLLPLFPATKTPKSRQIT